MSNNPKIRWRKSDEKKLEKTVKNFNAKRARLIKKDASLADVLPEKLSKSQLREEIVKGNRYDFNKLIKGFKRFSNKGAEKLITSETGNTITMYEKRDIQYKVQSINVKRKRELEKLIKHNPDIAEKKRLTTGDTAVQQLQPKKFNFNKIKKGKEWEMFVQSVEKQSKSTYTDEKMELYKQNYLKAIENVFGENGEELYNLISGIDPQTLVDNFYDDPILNIDFIYDPLEEQVILENILLHWQNIMDG